MWFLALCFFRKRLRMSQPSISKSMTIGEGGLALVFKGHTTMPGCIPL
ncbi:hypothetical protein ABIB83_009088 [Bradyrhizobium sp. I1.8.5]